MTVDKLLEYVERRDRGDELLFSPATRSSRSFLACLDALLASASVLAEEQEEYARRSEAIEAAKELSDA